MLLCSLACCKEESKSKVDYAVISGTIINNGNTEALLQRDDFELEEFRNLKLTITDKGTFKDTIQPGRYYYSHGMNITYFYLEAGDKIHLDYDAKDFKNTLKITGNAGRKNTYFFKKFSFQLSNNIYRYIQKEEAGFRMVSNEYYQSLYHLLARQEMLPDDFVEREKRELRYNRILLLLDYVSVNAVFDKKVGFKPSEDFIAMISKELSSIDYENEADFQYSKSYKKLLYANLLGKISLNVKDYIPQTPTMLLKECAKVKNQRIKNYLAFMVVQHHIATIKNYDLFYEVYQKLKFTNEDYNQKVKDYCQQYNRIAKGKDSPKFFNYERYGGGTTSFDDLKGTYLYIDVWASWCKPCIAEIPSLKKVKEKYKGKNIRFVSISVDVAKDKDKWKSAVRNHRLSGIQLLADKDLSSDFIKAYQIGTVVGIPNFILIDPNGKIISKDAPRPSDAKLIKLFDELGL